MQESSASARVYEVPVHLSSQYIFNILLIVLQLQVEDRKDLEERLLKPPYAWAQYGQLQRQTPVVIGNREEQIWTCWVGSVS